MDNEEEFLRQSQLAQFSATCECVLASYNVFNCGKFGTLHMYTSNINEI